MVVRKFKRGKRPRWTSKGLRVRGTKVESWVWLELKGLRLSSGGAGVVGVRPAPLCFLRQSVINLHRFVDGLIFSNFPKQFGIKSVSKADGHFIFTLKMKP